MRILYGIDSTGMGGAETLLLGLMRAARARGDEVHLAYFTPGPLGSAMAAEAQSVTRLAARGWRDPLAFWRAWRLVRRLRPDVVHSHLTKSDLALQLAARLAGVRRRIVTLHNTDRWRARRLLARVYRILAASGADHVLAVSEEVARHAVTTGSVAPRQIMVVPNGVDAARFASVPALDPERLAAQGWVLAIIGRLHPQKDHPTFLKAARRLADRAPGVRFRILGDGPLRAELEAESRALGLSDRLSFMGNVLDMPAALEEIDGVVLSSAWEGLPMVLLEAMAAARPVVATDVGEVGSVLRHGIDGLVVPPGDPEALAQAMAALIKAPERAAAMGLAGRTRVSTGFAMAAMQARIFALYGAGGLPKSPLA